MNTCENLDSFEVAWGSEPSVRVKPAQHSVFFLRQRASSTRNGKPLLLGWCPWTSGPGIHRQWRFSRSWHSHPRAVQQLSARGWQSSQPRTPGLCSSFKLFQRACSGPCNEFETNKKVKQTDNRKDKDRETERERGKEWLIREMGGCCSLGVK